MTEFYVTGIDWDGYEVSARVDAHTSLGALVAARREYPDETWHDARPAPSERDWPRRRYIADEGY